MIKNLLFDLGGVIMDIRRENCVKAFQELGMSDIGEFLGDYGQKGAFKLLEEGALTPDEFRAEIMKSCPVGTTGSQIDDAFNQFLVGIPAYRLEALAGLRRRFGVYLLSNTNKIMWDSRIAEEFRKIPGREMDSYFDGTVTSFEARALKPSAEIFGYAVRKLGIVPEETLFLDDSQENIRAAVALGFHGAVVPASGDVDVFDVINRYLSSAGDVR
jgi:putative hydrolase of the HAD superfamily